MQIISTLPQTSQGAADSGTVNSCAHVEQLNERCHNSVLRVATLQRCAPELWLLRCALVRRAEIQGNMRWHTSDVSEHELSESRLIETRRHPFDDSRERSSPRACTSTRRPENCPMHRSSSPDQELQREYDSIAAIAHRNIFFRYRPCLKRWRRKSA